MRFCAPLISTALTMTSRPRIRAVRIRTTGRRDVALSLLCRCANFISLFSLFIDISFTSNILRVLSAYCSGLYRWPKAQISKSDLSPALTNPNCSRFKGSWRFRVVLYKRGGIYILMFGCAHVCMYTVYIYKYRVVGSCSRRLEWLADTQPT